MVLPVCQTSNNVPTLTVKISKQLRQQIAAAAKRRRITQSELVREAIEKSLRSQTTAGPSAFDLISDLIGIGDEGPSDLSTNKKHMAGFGLDNAEMRDRRTR